MGLRGSAGGLDVVSHLGIHMPKRNTFLLSDTEWRRYFIMYSFSDESAALPTVVSSDRIFGRVAELRPRWKKTLLRASADDP